MARYDLPPGPSYPALIQGIGLWTRPLAFLERCSARYGRRFTISFPFTEPFVMHSEPEHIKEIYTAPPDVLWPGEGARVLEPIVGTRSVILLDGDAHMTQRKLMLPAFHGEKMQRLEDLVREVTERELATWPREVELHPLFQALTLEIILRAVFGFDHGPAPGFHPRGADAAPRLRRQPAHPDPAARRGGHAHPGGSGLDLPDAQPRRPAEGLPRRPR